MPQTRRVFWLVPKVSILQRTTPPGVSAVNTSAIPTTSDGIEAENPDMSSPVASAAAAASSPLSAAQPTERGVVASPASGLGEVSGVIVWVMRYSL